MSDLVCPDCGHEQFTIRSYQVVQETVGVSMHGSLYNVAEEVVDYERGDDPLECDDCGSTWEIDELITPDEYADAEDEDA